MAVINNEKLAEGIKKFQERTAYPSNFWIFQQLLHPILISCLVLPAYGVHSNIGRIFLGVFHKFSVLSKAVYRKEKKGEISEHFPKRMPNTLALLALNQFKKLERFNQHRRELAGFYERELKNSGFILPLAKPSENMEPVFMRYPILKDSDGVSVDTDEILKQARKKKIFLDDGWRKASIVPPDTDISKMQYIPGSCPRTEKIAKTIINLPTHINISEEHAQKIIDFLKTI